MNIEKLKNNLTAHGFDVVCFATKEEAAAYLDCEIDAKSVGFGGSVTLEQLGLYEKLSQHNEVFWHWRVSEGTDAAQVRDQTVAAQIYLTSVNGIAETGEIINIDGRCNRVAAMVYGHEKVYYVVGVNKIAEDVMAAIDRARNIAAPLNAKRLGVGTPCAKNGDRCYDCDSPSRICRDLSVLWRAPLGVAASEVVIIQENLGY